MTPDQVRQVLSTAVLAPSVHNTQPWQFAETASGLEVRADRTRALPGQDPLGRELLVSCGGAAAYAALAVRGLGLDATLTFLPVPGDPDLLALLEAGAPLPVTEREQRLLDAVPLRHTDRSAFADRPVPDDVVEALAHAAAEEGATLTTPWQGDRVVALEVLVAEADRELRADPDVVADLGRWTRTGPLPADGVPVDALPAHGAGRGTPVPLRDFDPGSAAPAGPVTDPPPVERPLLQVLSTPGDTPRDWLAAGAGLARLLLTATDAGLVVNPQTQVLEVPWLRERLARELGLTGSPQMLLRTGYPDGPGSPRTGRRSVDEVLVTGSGAR